MSKFILSAFGDEIADCLEVQMDVLEQNGIKYIEMRGVNGKPLVKHTLDEVRNIKKELDNRGFKISAIGSPIGKIDIIDDFEQHLELFKHTLKIAEILETKYIRMFSFFIPRGNDASIFRGEVMRRWKEFIKAVKGTGIVLLHENEKEIYGDIPQRCLDIVKTMNSSQMGVIFDPANFVQCDVETYPEAYGLLKEHIVYIHVKDAVKSGHQVVPSGEGDGKIKEILSDLYKSNFEGFLSIEPHLNDSLPGGGPELFKTACNSLKKILFEVTGKKY